MYFNFHAPDNKALTYEIIIVELMIEKMVSFMKLELWFRFLQMILWQDNDCCLINHQA